MSDTLPTAQLHLGDCLEYMRTLEAGSVDAVITDPPYGATEIAWDNHLVVFAALPELWRILSPTGVFVSFAQPPFSFALGMQAGHFRHSWVWVKDKAANWPAAPYMPMKITEDVLVFCRAGFAANSSPRAVYHPQMVEGEPYDRHKNDNGPGMRSQGQSWAAMRERPESSWGILRSASTHLGALRYPYNILRFPVPWGAERVHPTQKPVDLLAYLIRTYTDPGGTVLDFFAGSGTTGVACMQTGRNFVGCELDEGYFRVAEKRIAETQMQSPLPAGVR